MRKHLALVVIGCLYWSTAQAGIISLNTISADSTPSTFNANNTAISGAINGQIQGSATTGSSTNILASSIGRLDMGAEVNPATRDTELLGIGVDSTTAQTTFVYTGLTPATSATLVSDISAGTAYVNGIRVSKNATSETYTASMDNYVDLSQTGSYTIQTVAVGGTAPSVAANSARIAKVTTSGTAVTTVTDLARRTLSGLVVPSNYRSGLLVSGDSSTTIKVFPGTCEINNTMVSKTTATTLGLTVAGDWAGGASLQAANTYAFVGIDANGNLKLHTTAPTHQNYAVSLATGKKRYATWSSTVYRILGWFYMNSVSSGTLSADTSVIGNNNYYEVGNIKEGDVSNTNITSSTTNFNTASFTFVTDPTAYLHFYSSGNPLSATYNAGVANSNGQETTITVSVDSAGMFGSERMGYTNSTTTEFFGVSSEYQKDNTNQGTHLIEGKVRTISNTGHVNQRSLRVREE